MFAPFGVAPAGGYEVQFFDWARNTVVGGHPWGYSENLFAWRTVFDRTGKTVGGKLLVSGWWGLGRKINYTGEIGVYLAFALTTGFGHWGPYVLPLTLIVLLSQRAARDDKKCRKKYGELWEAYRKRVPYRVVPGVY